MKLKSKTTIGSLLVTTMAAAAVALPSAAQAGIAAQAGDVCTLGGEWAASPTFGQVYGNLTSFPLLYTLQSGSTFRISALASGGEFYRGNGYGQSEGYLKRIFIVQSSCHP